MDSREEEVVQPTFSAIRGNYVITPFLTGFNNMLTELILRCAISKICDLYVSTVAACQTDDLNPQELEF